jgi:putative hydrolase of the HAD superfamily
MIEYVFFDAGGTLIEPYPSVGAVYARAGRAHGLTASIEQLEAAFRKTWVRHVEREGDAPIRMGRDDASTRDWWRRLVVDVLEGVGFAGDREACFAAFFEAFASKDAWRIFDDVAETLDALEARGVRMGVISNWDYRLHDLLSTLDLRHRFEPVLISADVRLAKPDPAFFRLALDEVRLPPERVLYVGDRFQLDIAPARSVGMEALLIDRGQREPAREGAIADLTEVVEFLDALRARQR